ncbi:hypothetical protein [Kitasatospora sp. NPDC056181]|uniref:hypothetical protein n=1 Tax=Kitasatospora sp. NPDC056181 TaxID=3345737 RepID=UPI0035D75231
MAEQALPGPGGHRNDRTINPDVERFGHRRAGMTTVEVDSSHLVMPARPEAVAELIKEAVRSTAR